jgi:hypothetical protein
MDAKAPLASPTFTGTVTLPSGTVTSTMIADGTIVDADINASAAIALSKLATDPLARANHTGSQAASTISDFNEAAQDAIGTILGTGLSYNDAGPGIGINNAALTDYLIDGVSGSSYGLIGTSAYLDVKNTNGYNKEIELDIAAVKTQLNTDGYLTTSSTSTLTNKTLTSPTINSGALSGTFTGAPTFSDTTASTSSTTGAVKIGGGLGVVGNIYVGSASKVGYVNASNVSVVYQYYNAATNSLDTVFG